jgi:hypothetical protein
MKGIATILQPALGKRFGRRAISCPSREILAAITHLRPDFMQDELARVPDFALEIGSRVAVFDPFLTLLTQNFKPWHDVSPEF